MTYSLLAVDEQTGQIGGAIQSHYFAVGRRALSLRPGVGAVVSQSFGSPAFGPRLLDAMSNSADLAVTLDLLLEGDPNRALRQVMAIDASGRIVSETGVSCVAHAGSAMGPGVVAGGNMLEAESCQAMVDAYIAASDQPFVARLLAGLEAAERWGGDRRGRMSAALMVVGPERTDWPSDGTLIDVRVDHDGEPLAKLRRLVEIAEAYRVLGRVVYAPGFLVGEAAAESDRLSLAEVDAALESARRVMPDEPELVYWASVVADRMGDSDRARQLREDAFARRPKLRGFAEALEAAWHTPPRREA